MHFTCSEVSQGAEKYKTKTRLCFKHQLFLPCLLRRVLFCHFIRLILSLTATDVVKPLRCFTGRKIHYARPCIHPSLGPSLQSSLSSSRDESCLQNISKQNISSVVCDAHLFLWKSCRWHIHVLYIILFSVSDVTHSVSSQSITSLIGCRETCRVQNKSSGFYGVEIFVSCFCRSFSSIFHDEEYTCFEPDRKTTVHTIRLEILKIKEVHY